jgi:surface polysaccharide O-acyltransferase-like enzyme
MESPERIQSIDTIKVIASFAVILLHTAPFEFSALAYNNNLFLTLEIIVYLLSRFAVPYFFLASGYFFGKSLEKGTPLIALYKKQIKKLAILFLAWSLFYGIFTNHLIASILKYNLLEGFKTAIYQETFLFIKNQPLVFLLQGTGVHLWFLPSLAIGLSIISLFLALKQEKYILPFATLLYIFGVLGSAYSETPIGAQLYFNTRNGPFFGTIFIALGWRLSGKRSVSRKAASLVLLIGCLLQFLEAFLLHYFFKINSFYDYAFATVIFGSGVFLYALSSPSLGKGTILESLSSLSLGIYLFHPFVFYLLRPFRQSFPPFIWDITISIVVFIFSLQAVILLKKTTLTRKFLT